MLFAAGSLGALARYFGCEISELELAIDQVLDCLYLHQSKVIKWPQALELNQVSEQFSKKAGFPGIVGVIGESHMEIRSSKKLFYNCDNFHSIICLAVVNPDKSFSHIFTGFPGSYNTSYVFEQSLLHHQLEQNQKVPELMTSTFYLSSKVVKESSKVVKESSKVVKESSIHLN